MLALILPELADDPSLDDGVLTFGTQITVVCRRCKDPSPRKRTAAKGGGMVVFRGELHLAIRRAAEHIDEECRGNGLEFTRLFYKPGKTD